MGYQKNYRLVTSCIIEEDDVIDVEYNFMVYNDALYKMSKRNSCTFDAATERMDLVIDINVDEPYIDKIKDLLKALVNDHTNLYHHTTAKNITVAVYEDV